MSREQLKNRGEVRFVYAVAGMLLLGVVPSAAITVFHRFFASRALILPSLHVFMESLGVLAEFLLAFLLLFIRKRDRDLAPHIWVASGLLAMGILDGLHAAQAGGTPLAGLRSLSTLCGGFLFALVWLPARVSRSRAADALPLCTVVATTFVGVSAVAHPGLFPMLATPEGYAVVNRIATITGGIFFFMASVRFAGHYRASGEADAFLFASLCILFGMAELVFPFSPMWYADWWFWHFLRLVAFLHIVYYVFFVFQQTLTELKELNETLERKVTKRTTQLADEVAERTRTQEALKESETRYRRLVEAVTGYTFSVTVEGGLASGTSHSSGCVAVTGYSPEDYAANPGLWLQMVPEEDRQTVLDQVTRVLSGNETPPLEHRIRHKDGRVRWVKSRTAPHFDGEGRLVAYDGLISDITERKLAEEEIKTYNEELLTINRVVTACSGLLGFREVLGTVLEETMQILGLEEGGICIVNSDGSLSSVTHRGSVATALIDPGAGGLTCDCCYRTSCAGLQPVILREREAVIRHVPSPHGADIRFHAAFPFVTGNRACVGVLCLFSQTEARPSDRSLRLVETITAHVALLIENVRLYEETLSHAATLERKVTERTLELEQANCKLREIDRIKSLFIASMSHELRTPLNSVIGFSSILLNEWVGTLNEEQKENLAIVLKAGEHLLSLINDVIDVSKIEAGQIEIYRERFDLRDVIDEAVSTLGKDIRDKGLELRVECGHRLELHTDRRRLLQCLLNLMNNAAKYTEKGGISVRARGVAGERPLVPGAGRGACGDCVEIAVEDTGVGISGEDLARIFEPFTRLHSPLRPRVPGTGLGLYLTRKLVTEVLRGEIRLASEATRGSTFALVIPVNGGE